MSSGGAELNDSYMEFIDDERDVQDQGPSGYGLINVTSSL